VVGFVDLPSALSLLRSIAHDRREVARQILMWWTAPAPGIEVP
jgi:hypothetical protein